MVTASILRRISIMAATACLSSLAPLTTAEETLQNEKNQDDQDSVTEGQRCVRSRSISKTEVLDDQNILFYMRGTAIYLNYLPKPCKRLSDEGRFMYYTSVSRLCKSDSINILREAGLSMSAGRACKLGSFYAITREDVDKLKTPPEVEAKPIPPAEPEEPGAEETRESEQTGQNERSEIDED